MQPKKPDDIKNLILKKCKISYDKSEGLKEWVGLLLPSGLAMTILFGASQ